MPQPIVTVFGGTGFLGRRVVKSLLAHDYCVRVATRHPSRAQEFFSNSPLESVEADINQEESTSAAVQGAYGVVNAVSLYVEKDQDTFRSIHVKAAAQLARLSRDAGVERLVQISGIGSNPNSRSPYIRSRGEGEGAVRAAFPDATLIRPAIMFGTDDGLLTPLADLLRRFPVFGLFGHGRTKLQPVHVENVAEAIVCAMTRALHAPCYELGGPKTYTYRSLVEAISRQIGKRRVLVPIPFALWRPLAYGAEMLPSPPITRNQIELMRRDNIASDEIPGLASLEITPTALEQVLAEVLEKAR